MPSFFETPVIVGSLQSQKRFPIIPSGFSSKRPKDRFHETARVKK